MRQCIPVYLMAALSGAALAQEGPTFEAASLKLFPEGEQLTWAGCQGDPGRIDCRHVNLRTLMAKAYAVRQQEILGPASIDDIYFNLDARMPTGTKNKDSAEMLRNLLVQRFHLETHREQRPIAGYALTVGKGGLKIKEAPAEPPADEAPAASGPLPVGPDGFRVLRPSSYRGGPIILFNNGHAKLQASNMTMATLAQSIGGQIDKIVVDETGLPGKYDVMLYWAPQGAEPGAPRQVNTANVSVEASGPDADMFAAVEQQLGLKLASKKVARDCVVVDKADKAPTEN